MPERRRSRGHTLVELMAACAVLAIAAAVALPSAQPVAEARADTAVGEVVQALRFARQEAIRSGAYRMLRCDATRNEVSVYIPDTNGASATMLKHPLSKMDYTVNLGQAPAGSNIALTACRFQFADRSTAATLAFDGDGDPVRGTGTASDQTQALSSGTIVLGAGNVTRTVAVDVNGRVTTS
jgi:prepilin-type N-terminal cleavage/methylation domain-containing protein